MKQLEKILKNWQDFLGLQHWSLTIIIKKLEDAEDGEIDYDNREFTGTIFLQEGQSIEKYEETIVHELLHLIFEEIDHIVDQLRDKDNTKIVDLYDDFLHKAIGKMTKALVRKRKRKAKPKKEVALNDGRKI